MGYALKSSSTAKPLLFLLVSSTDHVSGVTGATAAVTISKNGAAFGAPAGAVTELANGWYKVAGNATDTNTVGPLLLHATAAGADPVDDAYSVVAYDPDDAVRLGLTALPNAAAGANGGLPLGDASGRVDVGKALGTAVTLDANNALNVSTKYVAGTAQTARDLGANLDAAVSSRSAPATAQTLDFTTALPSNPADNSVGEALFLADALRGRKNMAQAGTSTTITLDAGASATDGLYVGDTIYLYGGTGGGLPGTGQQRTVTAYVGSTKVATVDPAWTTAPDVTSKFLVLPHQEANVGLWRGSVPNALISGRTDANAQATAAALAFNLTGNVTGNLSGSVGSVTGAVGSVTGSVGSVVSAVTAGTVSDKAGYKLASDGLDTVSAADPGAGSFAALNFRQKLLWLFRRGAHSVYDSNAGTVVVKDSSGTTISSQTATNSGGIQTLNEPS